MYHISGDVYKFKRCYFLSIIGDIFLFLMLCCVLYIMRNDLRLINQIIQLNVLKYYICIFI